LTRVDFNIERMADVEITRPPPLDERDLMSPYVWRQQDGKFGMLVRAVPKSLARFPAAPDRPASEHPEAAAQQDHPPAQITTTGTIWYGTSDDGLHFDMHEKPVLAPGPGPLDLGGCEDPTLVIWDGRYIVYYTGVDETRACGQMLYAEGPDILSLEKKGVALASTKTAGNTKEATVARTKKGRWRLFYEYARDDASLIGLALGKTVAGPWDEQPTPFEPRPNSWDAWHLSTGPMLTSDPEMPVMFYNGATRDARWRIGWIAFNEDCTQVVDRCIQPLLIPPPPEDRLEIDIAFAASVVAHPGESGAFLYYSLADRRLARALVRRT
jgi:predicted GH43/DUF377 family glycosyl hydrolase